MNLLLINYEFPPVGGGAATATWELARSFVQLGHRPIVLTARFPGRNSTHLPDGVSLIEVSAIRRRREACTPFEMTTFALGASWGIRDILRREKIDGIIAFFSIPCGPVAWWGSRRVPVPYLVSLRGGDVPGTEPNLTTLHRFLAPLRRRILKGARAVIANSSALQRRAVAADPVSVGIIPNGVDATFFFPPEKKRPPFPFRWLFVGRLQPQKNLGWLLQRLKELHANGTSEWELHVVGDGPLRSEWTHLATTLGLGSRVHWHGWQTREQIRDQYQRCHALVQPSLYEGMANSVLEALACGLAIVTSDEPANLELVRESRAGDTLSLADASAAEAALRDAMIGDRWNHWGKSARTYAEKHLDWKRSAQAYLEAFAFESTAGRIA